MAASALELQESRSTSRVRAPGWANISCGATRVTSDRLYDISQAGLSLFLDIQLPLRQECQLQLSIYRGGKVHVLQAHAHCVYTTLVGVTGFRHGFHFSALDDQDRETLTRLLA